MNKKTIKIFLGDKIICLTNDVPFLMNLRGTYIVMACDRGGIERLRECSTDLINREHKRIYLWSRKVSNFWKLFQSQYRIIEAAGGLVKNKKGKYLFIFRNGKWDLPKGKREKGETIKKCAKREVEEECGIKGLKIVRQLPTTYHIYSLEEKQVLKPTHWFEMECDDASVLIPQTEEGITEVRWFTKTDLKIVKRNTYPLIKDVISEINKKNN